MKTSLARWLGLALPVLLGIPIHASAEILGPVETRSARAGELDLHLTAGAAVAVGETSLFFQESRNRFDLPHLQFELSFLQRVALELEYSVWMMRFEEAPTGHEQLEDGFASGDLHVRSRYGLLIEGEWRPALAFQFGFKLPNARARNGFGTNETDCVLGALISKDLGPLGFHGSLALGILGDPTRRAAQDDVLLSSFLLEVRPAQGLRFLAEIAGMPPSAMNTGRAVIRGGVGFRVKGFDLGVAAGVGISEDSPSFVAGLDLGFHGSLTPGPEE